MPVVDDLKNDDGSSVLDKLYITYDKNRYIFHAEVELDDDEDSDEHGLGENDIRTTLVDTSRNNRRVMLDFTPHPFPKKGSTSATNNSANDTNDSTGATKLLDTQAGQGSNA